MATQTISEKITDFVHFYNDSLKAYAYYYDKVNECEKLECDIKHKIELSLYKDRNEKMRLYTELQRCLKDRRYFKNKVEELEPFVRLFRFTTNNSAEKESSSKITLHNNSVKFMNLLQNALGEVRKIETYHSNRKYKPRIIIDDFNNEEET